MTAAASHLMLREFDGAAEQCRMQMDHWSIVVDHGNAHLILALAQTVATIVGSRGDFENGAQLLGFSDAIIAQYERTRAL